VTANELFTAGELNDAVDAQIGKVKGQPADQAARLFLAELFLFQGDLDRAQKHLDMLQYDSPQAQAGLELIKSALTAEKERRQVMAGKAQPMGLKESPDHVRLRLQALQQYSQGHTSEGNQLIEQANAGMPQVACEVDGQRVDDFRDGDELFGTVLEVFSRGRYCWVPAEQIEKLEIAEPRAPRDVLFLPAHLSLKDGLEGDVHLPGLYPNTHSLENDEIRLGRATDWMGEENEPLRGAGGRAFLLSGLTKPLMHIRTWTTELTPS
jgi:type VI secretion system protein ImpE